MKMFAYNWCSSSSSLILPTFLPLAIAALIYQDGKKNLNILGKSFSKIYCHLCLQLKMFRVE